MYTEIVNSEPLPEKSPNETVVGGVSDVDAELKTNNQNNQQQPQQHLQANQNKKKRPRENRPEAKDRLCHSVEKGITCPILDTCPYCHDALEYLENKPPDIGPICPVYRYFGYCLHGISCRFGDCHIDRTTGKNKTRSIEDGGVLERVSINVLSKEVQILLRKKKYNFSTNNNPNNSNGKLNSSSSKSGTKSSSASSSGSNAAAMAAVLLCKKLNDEAATATAAATQAVVAQASATVVIPSTSDADASISSAMSSSTQTNNSKHDKFVTGSMGAYDKLVKLVDFSNKVYVAPLTTVGNLPFRRILREFGADITCGEMAMSQNLEQGQASEWALLRRHASEGAFGVQIASNHKEQITRVAKLLENETSTDFVDLNCGCPIDVVCNRGCGSALLQKPPKLCELVAAMTHTLNRSVTVKIRTGWSDKDPMAHKLLPLLQKVSNHRLAAVMIHGRSRAQRYSKAANWEYVLQAAQSQDTSLPLLNVIGNGDIFSYTDWTDHRHMLRLHMNNDEEQLGLCSCAMIGRGALIKPWLPQEIKESRHVDISASERLDMLKKFCHYGLEHWGSDDQGISTTRRFLLEWLSFLCRYAPIGLTENTPQKMQDRPPTFVPRNDTEALLSSYKSEDWIKISSMFLGPPSESFRFEPKHKAPSTGYDRNNSMSNSSSSSNSNSIEGIDNIDEVEDENDYIANG